MCDHDARFPLPLLTQIHWFALHFSLIFVVSGASLTPGFALKQGMWIFFLIFDFWIFEFLHFWFFLIFDILKCHNYILINISKIKNSKVQRFKIFTMSKKNKINQKTQYWKNKNSEPQRLRENLKNPYWDPFWGRIRNELCVCIFLKFSTAIGSWGKTAMVPNSFLAIGSSCGLEKCV